MRGKKVLAVAGSFFFGAAIALVTRTAPEAPMPFATNPEKTLSRSPAGTCDPRPPESESNAISRPEFLNHDPALLTQRQRSLGRLFDITPRAALQKVLTCVIWGDPVMERKALNLFRALSRREDQSLFVELHLLGHISDVGVQSEFVAWAHAEVDPVRKSQLAKIAGGGFQPKELTPVVIELLVNADAGTIQAALGDFKMERRWFDQNEQSKDRAVRLIRQLADVDQPEGVRISAIRALDGAHDADTVRLLLGVLGRERKTELLQSAMRSLPSTYLLTDEHQSLAIAMIKVLYAIATDVSRHPDVRLSAARAVDSCNGTDEYSLLTPTEEAEINGILDPMESE